MLPPPAPVVVIRDDPGICLGVFRPDLMYSERAGEGVCTTSPALTTTKVLFAMAIGSYTPGSSRRHPREFISWRSMLSRCYDPKQRGFHIWGGRGIAVCERWMRFDCFLADMGARPEGCSLDRIDNDGNYEPGNVRWATRKVQNANQRRCLFVNGMTPEEIAERYGLTKQTVYNRIRFGWSFDQIVQPPISKAVRQRHRQRLVEFEGSLQPFTDLCARFGLNRVTVHNRMLRQGLTLEQALLTPKQKPCPPRSQPRGSGA